MKRSILILSLLISTALAKPYDLTIVGGVLFADGLGRFPIALIDMLKDDLAINIIPTKPVDREQIHDLKTETIIHNPDKTPGNVALLTDVLWYPKYKPHKFMPKSKICLAYSMIESTAIPQRWVQILNKKFDAVIVPDPWLVDVYKSSGVKKPIFIIPNPLYLDDFLNYSFAYPKKNKNTFTFGMSAACMHGKNHTLLVDAFAQEFKNDPNVQLKIHTRGGYLLDEIYSYIKKQKLKNVMFINKVFTQQEYITFLNSLDCYVLPSQGEGFSNTPREALAMGIPCIISNNTGHKTICDTGFVESVRTDRLISAYYKGFNVCVGKKFECECEDLARALKEVYTNYELHKQKALQGREWVKQYSLVNLKNRFRSLIKPKKVILSTRGVDEVDEDYLETTSPELYTKYLSISRD